MIALDTNLLIYAHRRGVPQHEAAQQAIEAACSDPRGVGIASASIAEFFAVVTHKTASGKPSTAKQAQRFLEELARDGDVQTWLPGPSFGARLLQMASDLNVTGARIFDLQIAITALENGATEIWSHDQRFIAVPGLRLLDPLAVQPVLA